MNIYEKIIAVSKELRVSKEGNNEYKGFKYFRPDDIAREIVPLLEKHNLILFFDMPFSKEKEMYEGRLEIRNSETNPEGTSIEAVKEGAGKRHVVYQFDIPLTTVAGASEAQNAGATMTYCKRYMIMNAFNIAENEADPDATMGALAKPAAKAQAKTTGAKPTAGGKASTKFDEMMLKLEKVKKAQLPIFLDKIKASTQYSDEQKNMFIARVMELQQK